MRSFSVRAALAVSLVLASGPIGINCAFAAGSPDKGKTAFIVHGCFQCHGTVGQGAARESNGKVLYDTQLPIEAFIGFVRGTNRAMPPYSEKILSDADLTDIYAYLESLPKPANYKTIPLLNQQ
jgi:ubiquinol-cytochrome c reductase cytochrome c subunit